MPLKMKKKACNIFFLLLTLISGLPILAQSTASQNVRTFKISSPQLETLKKIWVYLPISYKTSEKKYPVLYLQDAQNLFDINTSYSGEWRVDEILDSLKLDLIVIGIEHGNDNRISELTPFPHPEYKGGGAKMYLDFMLNTVKPKVDSLYRTCTSPKKTFIGGSSLGGLFSYYASLKHPEIFGKALIFSPSFWFTEDIFDLTESTDFKRLSENQFYFRAGEKESETMVSLMRKMEELLYAQGISEEQINIESLPEGKHNEALWSSLFAEAAMWLVEK